MINPDQCLASIDTGTTLCQHRDTTTIDRCPPWYSTGVNTRVRQYSRALAVTGIGNLRTTSVALVLNTRAVFTERVIAVFEQYQILPCLGY